MDLCWGELVQPPQLNLGAHQYIFIFFGEFVSFGKAATSMAAAAAAWTESRRQRDEVEEA